MKNKFGKIKALCAIIVGFGLTTFSATPMVTSVTAQQRYPWNGLVDIVVTMSGAQSDVENAICTFAATNSATKTALKIAHVAKYGDDVGFGMTWTRRFIWDTNADLGEVKIDDLELFAEIEKLADKPDGLGGVQLWDGGPYWAECNVGATEPEGYGLYFWWGDMVGHSGDWSGFTYDKCPTFWKSYSELLSLGYIDSSGNLTPSHDVARAHLGAPWRMPTSAEFNALINNCTTEWTIQNGVQGRLVTGKGAYASRSIFLPATGLNNGSTFFGLGSIGTYWSSMPNSDLSNFAWRIYFNSGDFYQGDGSRYFGQSVRAVRGDIARFNVVYLSNGGDGVMADSTFEVGADATLPTCSFTREGYYFMGWATSANGDVVYSNEASVENLGNKGETITLYAVWSLEGVQLWECGPYWSVCNVGATEPEEYGYYFWWGDTVGYTRVSNRWDAVDGSQIGFSFNDENCPTYDKSNLELESLGYIDSTGNLVAEHDAATAHLGAPWRMPTEAEFLSLTNNCTTTWTMRNGISGRLVTGKGAYASKSIFLPAAGSGSGSNLDNVGSNGYYWSSTPCSGSSNDVWGLYFYSGRFSRYSYRRYCGQSVRAVRDCPCFNVVYEANGGDGTMADSTFEVGADATLPMCCFSREGYYFMGWATSAEGNVVYSNEASVENLGNKDETITLYAIWSAIPEGVQLWEGGPYWAECNVGATEPEEYGYYFWWGDTVGQFGDYEFDESFCSTFDKSYSDLQSMGYIDSTGNLTATYDAATVYLGAPWRMPTYAEFAALRSNCTYAWVTRSGVRGRLVRGKGEYASRSIFLPAAGGGYDSGLERVGSDGCYWSSTPDSEYSNWPSTLVSNYSRFALGLDLGSFGWSDGYRSLGRSVRAVRDCPCFNVVYEANGGDGTMADSTFEVGAEVSLPMCSFTREGYVFMGWATSVNGDVVYIDEASAKNLGNKDETITLYAVWSAIPKDSTEGVQLWEGGPYWAECNVGATEPEEYGYYFWWGDTVGYTRVSNRWDAVDGSRTGFSFSSGICPTYDKSNSELQELGYIDSTGNLVAEHDAATAHLGASWRMPTDAEFAALISNCTTTWTMRNGISGRLVTGKGAYASKSIFLPAAGYGHDTDLYSLGSYGGYWSSTPRSDYSGYAWYLTFDSGNFSRSYGYRRYDGHSVRPVRGFAK